ncbi:MAG: sulfatase [Verrucomicrobiales bacterium]|nr:sulfatase [Verrucomicrobiales bacterium]
MHHFSKTQFVALLIAFVVCASTCSAAQKPNILLIIADDLGADSHSLFNSATNGATLPPTPNINSLATNGVVFSRAYANPLCSPTRACLLTGRFGFRTGIGDVVGGAQPPLSATEFTLPKAFSTNGGLGYAMAQFGKWHLANAANSPSTVGGWTNYVGCLAGQVTDYNNWSKTSNGVTTTCTNYATTDLVNDAVAWMNARGTNAWFLWTAFNAPHTPLHLPPTNLCPSYATLPGTTADINARPSLYFDAMVQALDTEVGRLLAALPDRSNTHIIFLGDNGTMGNVIQPPYSSTRAKDTLYEGGTHVPLIIAGPAVTNPTRTNDPLVNMVDIYATILEMAGSSVAARVPSTVKTDCQSLLPMLQTTNTSSRYAYAELFSSGANTGQALRNSQYKIIHFYDRHDEFYDLKNDPYEKVNLLTNGISGNAQSNYFGLLMKLAGYQSSLAQPTVVSAFNNGQFSATVPVANLNYTLWRAPVLDDYAWSPQTNALAVTNGSSVSLTDTNANLQNFYRVGGSTP